tara:strand:- start:1049 stop:1657 length:609 start_codon:yes stop_codon:yes gene_type:complete
MKYIFIFINTIIFLWSIIISINHKNRGKKNLNKKYYLTIISNFLFINICIYYFFNKIIFDNKRFLLLDFFMILIFYDTWLYWIHRTILHRTTIFKKYIHIEHHSQIVIPSDWLNVNFIELLIQSFGIILPILLFQKINLNSFIIFAIFKQLFEIYIHSDTTINFFPLFINSKFHTDHHLHSGGNYSQLTLFWDSIMKTKIKK